METHYHIVDWEKHYEVDAHGKPWQPGQPFRKGPLLYLRVKPRRDWNTRLRELHEMCGEDMWAVVGVFEKLCQIVGCEERRNRENGVIRNSDGAPASDEDIYRMLALKPETWARLVAVLCHPRIRWLTTAAAQQATPASPGIPGNSGASPQSGTFPRNAEAPEFPQSCQVMSKQINTKQVKSREPVPIAQLLGGIAPSAPPERSLDEVARGGFDSTRLGFLAEMRRTLGAEERVECRTITNFERWVHESISSGRAGPELRRQALQIARDCVHGRKPVAVFLARAKKELGYVAPSRRNRGMLTPVLR
jgi:hypothetical protein